MKLIKLLAIIVFFGTLSAANQRAFAKDEWRRVQSKNFQLVGDADEFAMQRVAARLEQFRNVFTQLFPQMKFNSPIPTRVVVFKDKPTLDQFKPIEWAEGYFQAGDDVNYIVVPATGADENLTTVYHEYTHFLIDNSFGRSNIPAWLNEGIAEYYEKFQIENDQKVTLGATNENHLRLLQQGKFIPLETFFATDYYTLHKQTKQNAQLFYAEAWALTHFLLHGNGGARRVQFDEFIELLSSGAKPNDAFQKAFETDNAAIEAELKKYIAQRSLSSTVVSLKEKFVFDNKIETVSMSEADAKAFQGDLLYHIRRTDEAEKILSEALALDVNSSLANNALGMVKLKQKKYVEARSLLEKAIQTDAQNYLAFYSYAYAISREGTTEYGFATNYAPLDAEKMRENLRKAIALNPNFAESYNLYAFIDIVRNEQLSDGIAMIEKALAIAPGNQWYAIRKAELLMRREDFAAARAIVWKIMQTAADDQMKVYAENTMKNINSLEAQLADLKENEKRERNEAITDAPLSEEELARRREKALMESLNETLRFPRSDEKRLLGNLLKVDCQSSQIVYSLKVDNQIYQLKSDSFETLKMISFEPSMVNSELGCGDVQKENLSVVTFRPLPNSNAKIAGEIVSIEFVPKNFRFLSVRK